MQLTGRVAIVTGAGSGIGRAAALKLAQEGAKVAALELLAARHQAVVAEIQAAGGEAMGITVDVAQAEQVQQAVSQVAATWGRVDILIANAGINGVWAPIEDLSPDEWDQTLDVNLKGTFLALKYAIPHLKAQGGAVVITSSVNGTRMFSNIGASAYSAAKAAQVAFAKMAALELAHYRIRVNAICPGGVRTNIIENTHPRNLDTVRNELNYRPKRVPLTNGEPGQPEQLAQLICFLVSDNASHITGTEMWIDGAQSLL